MTMPSMHRGAGAAAPGFDDLQQAAEWFAVLQADAASDTDRRDWQRWLDGGPGPRAAWARVEAVAGEFAGLSGWPVRRVLEQGADAGQRRRRAVVRALALIPVVGMAGWLGMRTLPWQGWTAAERTGVGERREIVLADGSSVWLNTATALDVDFDGPLRRLVLHRGEVLVSTGHLDPAERRPLVVDVPQARLTARGTRFGVRHGAGDRVLLTVFEGAVEARPAAGPGAARTLSAGQQAWIHADRVDAPHAARGSDADWTRGMLVADGLRLADFIAELSRYRPGYVGCAPEVAELRIVGAFPLADTDRVLDALQATLPVTIHRPMSWWVSVAPAPAAARR